MITQSNAVNPIINEFFIVMSDEAFTMRGILPISDHEINLVFLNKIFKFLFNHASTNRADDISDKKDVQISWLSICLFSSFNRAVFADNWDFDLTWISHLRLDTVFDIFRELEGSDIINLVWHHYDA